MPETQRVSTPGEILAIDPGPAESAWLIYDPSTRRPRAASKVPNAALLSELPALAGSADTGLRRGVAIEMIASYGMAVGREVFETCLWIGRFMQAVSPEAVRLVYRQEVKLHLCRSARAKDANIRQALIDSIGPRGTKKEPGPTYGLSGDCWSALGVAVTAAETTCPPGNLR